MRALLILLPVWTVLAQSDIWVTQMRAAEQHRQQGRYREALQSYQEALHQSSTQPSPDMREIAGARCGIGVVWLELGEPRRAETQLQQSVEGFANSMPGGPEMALALLNLASALQYQRRFQEAEEANGRAITILEKVFGPGHPMLAAGFNNRGAIFLEVARCREALALFERAQQIWDSSLRAGHAHMGALLNNIGKGRLCLGEYREAKSALESALRVRERVLPAEHPDLAQSLATYAVVLEKLGKRREARAYRKRAEAIRARHAAENAIGQTVDVSGFRQR